MLVNAVGITPAAASLSDSNAKQTAWRAARQCRFIIQGCLREEEWKDADEEFYSVILEAIG